MRRLKAHRASLHGDYIRPLAVLLNETRRERDELRVKLHQEIIRADYVAAVEARADRLAAALEKIAEMHDGDINLDGTESDAWVFDRADDFVEAHGIARAAVTVDKNDAT
jgi:hypothetical protein